MAKEGFSPEEIEELISDLTGTTSTLNESIQELFGDDFSEDDLTEDNHNQIDNSIFLCDDCGWWCEISEESEEGFDGERVCSDCSELR